MKSAIELKNVSKFFSYSVDDNDSIKAILISLLRGKYNKGHKEKLEVLNNVSFTINQGEFVGIMGKNGAGKSTILKLISQIYVPNSGEVKTQGRIAPLLELGAGFASELSGYDNIFLNSSILGNGKLAVESKLQQIIDFTELGEKIHLPVKNYSSGMLMRLGFSIAAHMDSEIILLDEVLGVGDAHFQQKSLDKIQSLHKEGRTIVLVTHSPEQVAKFCDRCIVIDKTGVVFDGPANGSEKAYLNLF